MSERVGGAALVVVEVVHDDADGEAEELVDLAHPLGVALGQVVVDRDHVHAVAGERVQVAGEGGDERLAFAGSHLGDLALVQHHAADQLHVEVAHLHGAPAGLADHGKGLRQQLVQGCVFGCFRSPLRVGDSFELGRDPCPELDCLVAQLLIVQLA